MFNKGQFKKGHKTNIGRKCLEKTKIKIGKANSIKLKGKKQSKEAIRKRIESLALYWETHPEEKKYRSEVLKKRNPNYKGGITPLERTIRNSYLMKEWRMKIFERDNWTCQFCWKRGNLYLEAHHIKPFAKIIQENLAIILEIGIENYKELWDLTNGITLCKECHNLTKNGRKLKNLE